MGVRPQDPLEDDARAARPGRARAVQEVGRRAAQTIRQLLAEARRRLAASPASPADNPGREAALLLGHVLGLDEARLLARDDRPVDADEEARFEDLLARRAAGEPAAYLTGVREFYGRPFAVDSRVLIPRPETEHLIEEALALELPANPRILDVGTGSGCLAITLALEIPGARVTATDLSLGALAVARHNAHRHGVAHRVALSAQDLAGAFPLSVFDLVVSNPPYVDRADSAAFSPEVHDFEPHLALFAPDGGLATLTRIFAASAALRPGTPLLVEIGQGQSATVTERAVAAGLVPVKVRSDYAAIPRTLVFRRGGSA